MVPTGRNVLILAYMREERERESRREHMLKLCPEPETAFQRFRRFVRRRVEKGIESSPGRPQDDFLFDKKADSGELFPQGANHG